MGRNSAAAWAQLGGSALALLLGGSLLGCAAPKAPLLAAQSTSVATASGGGEVFAFPESTQSPRALAEVPPELVPFLGQCRLGDAALSRVAERFARRQSEGKTPLDAAEISFALRAEGSPYVWPRAWTLEGGDLLGSAALERMHGWLGGFGDGGERRCGVALATSGQRSVLAAVAVDALADLAPLPVSVRSGSWVDVEANLLVAASDAKVLVLGPSGAPYGVPTSFDGQKVRARFRADRPGPFLIQLLASVAGGPRPLLEATVYADVKPPASYFGDAAPGEHAGALATDPQDALLSMLNAARETEGSVALRRDAGLDAIALRHAEAMRKLGRIAHDAGDGDPQTRVLAAGVDALAAGENVAHALDVTRAHRALWQSPSHRENLLQPRFDRVGIGISRDADGSVWVCEVFADFADVRDPSR